MPPGEKLVIKLPL